MCATGDLLAGRYRLGDRIAVGGVGEVWRGTDTALARVVAVKLLRAEYAGHQEALARFRAEARHAGSLSHPAVARIYDYGEAGPACPPYLIMELVDGPSLADVLRRGPLDPARTMQVVAQAAAGLAAAHGAGLVHRDIKPANLLLSSAGQAKITDFGIAHAAGSVPLTRTGVLVGTPSYLAPERVAGASGTPASDLYALGIVAYECLAGHSPFSGEPLAVAAAHRERPLPRLPATVPMAVAALVGDLTAKDPAVRPADARAVARRAARLRDVLAAAAPTAAGPWSVALPGVVPPAAQPVTAGRQWPGTARGEPDGKSTAGDGLTSLGTTAARAAGHAGRSLRAAVAACRQGWAHRYGPGRAWPVRSVVLAVVTAALTAGLTGWQLGGVFDAATPSAIRTGVPPANGHAGGTRAPGAAGASHPARGAASAAARVSGASMTGLPVAIVRQQLRRLGLQVRVYWRYQGDHLPGTVLAIRPSGPLPTGSIVVVAAAKPPSAR